ncbi:ABC transporter permease [Bacillus chungangensis]|uniref:ABC-2 type transport system permease protein n=1 Tax=Bacillus chungangensis TaxID=587633 RepID=A0ABT9WTF7_9BACI|nr:ABC transporter permease [Bacillus chungangensis]MDQ0176403.1 ABC-2 type transport system permease protein [Bacillus chungangensis]
MNKIAAFCLFEIKRVFRNRSIYIVMFAMPILFAFIFGTVFRDDYDGEMIKLAIVDRDETQLSKELVKNIENISLFKSEKTLWKAAQKLLADKHVLGVVIINNGYGNNLLENNAPAISFKHGPNFTNEESISAIINHAIAKMKVQVAAAKVWSEETGNDDWMSMYEKIVGEVKSKKSKLTFQGINGESAKPKLSALSQSSAGFSIMFLMIVMISTTGAILEAKNVGVWYRLLSTPTTKIQVLSGYFFSFFLIGFIQFGLLMIMTSLLFKVHWGNMGGILLLASALILCLVGLGLLISSFVKTTEQQSAFGIFVVIPTCMLAGVYWPIEIMPDFMQRLADFIPQTWIY